MIEIKSVAKEELTQLISSEFLSTLTVEGQEILIRTVNNSTHFWIAEDDGKFIGFWGLIPPTLLSVQAYIWLYLLEDVTHRVSFARKSISAFKALVREFPIVVGHCACTNPSAIRWLKWLGATFNEPKDGFVAFKLGA